MYLSSLLGGTNVPFRIVNPLEPTSISITIGNTQVAVSEVRINDETFIPDQDGKAFKGNFTYTLNPPYKKSVTITIETHFHDVNPDSNEVFLSYKIVNGDSKLKGASPKENVAPGSIKVQILKIFLLAV